MRVPVGTQGDLRKGRGPARAARPPPGGPGGPARYYRNENYGRIGVEGVSIVLIRVLDPGLEIDGILSVFQGTILIFSFYKL